MKTALRIARLCLVLAAAAPAAALAGPPAPSAKPAPKPPAKGPAPAPAPATPAKQTMSDSDAIIMLVILGGVVVIGGGGFVVWRLSRGSGAGKGDGRPPEPILPERKHDWELRMTAEQEGALLRGVQAYRDGGHSLYLSHGDALITFYEPRMLVSLHHLTEVFLAAGPAGVADPVGVVHRILDGFIASESPGVLHLRKDWYSAPVDGLDFERFSTLCYDTLTRPQPYIEGTQGSSADENSGSMTLKVEVGAPLNTFCVDLRRVLPHVAEARRARPAEPLIELVRPVLQAMCRGELPGAMWTRGGSLPQERDLVMRVIATSALRTP